MADMKQVLVFGATGNLGGATARQLLQRGWQVRVVTRDPSSPRAQALAGLGAEVVQADMEDRASLDRVFDGIRRVFSVQNWSTSGVAGEVRQGKLVAEAARSAGVEHLVYGSAGSGEAGTGVPHFEAKLEVEAHMRRLALPFTVVRPGPFMELMSDRAFYPALGVWGAEPKVVGWELALPWVAVRDVGIAAARIFQEPEEWIGREITVFGDVKSLAECRAVFQAIEGRRPARIALPLWLFKRMAGEEFVLMWRWMVGWISANGPEALLEKVRLSRELNPALLDVEGWLAAKKAARPVLTASGHPAT
jgi:uncharacterized protein YbjT (DUF2867 family)